MKFKRYLSVALDSNQDKRAEDLIEWRRTRAEITDGRTGEVIFVQDDVEVPAQWSSQAANILASKYFRKAGVPSKTVRVSQLEFSDDKQPPTWLFPHRAEQGAEFGGETSARQVFHRLAGTWTYWAWKHGYFGPTNEQMAEFSKGVSKREVAGQNARVFYDEAYLMLAQQLAAPNSPQWFNTGLYWAYGIEGDDQGQWIVQETVA